MYKKVNDPKANLLTYIVLFFSNCWDEELMMFDACSVTLLSY